SLAPTQRIEGARLESLRITSSTEGAVIPRLYGRMRIGGNIVWATDFREETRTTTQRGGGKGGGGGKVRTTEYLYYASFAVALCEGPITGVGRIWADGKPLDMTGITMRWYPGDEAQAPDPFIAAKMGAANTPAYRGTAYIVFEELPLADFGNRIPQLSVEVFRPLADPDTTEGLTRAVTMIPASGEFTYATQAIRKTTGGAFGGTSGGTTTAENLNALPDTTDMVVALDRLQAMAPAVESVSLVVAWFGTDLRAGNCQVRPGVEVAVKATTPRVWSVNGVNRASAHLVSRDSEDRPVYGGTPSDFAVVQAIHEMKARGLRVTFYPFILMDVPPGNSLPNPYSDNAAEEGQPVFPWRGRITCSPAAGFAGSVDKTATAATQVASFFGAATPSNFAVSGETVGWTGPAGDWGLRRMILHYAHLCAAAGGVDAFLIGSEMRGLTTIRSGASTYPAVQAYRDLLADVRSILGAGTKIGYAADWSEYFGHQPGDGSGDVFFHLDPLWADPEIDFIGIDNYVPLSDWRDGFEHLDAAEGWPAIHDRAYLQANIAGGEGFDWFYASAADRSAQIRTP
ncbi:MAG: glycoside hydrolase TIM-barrel-like domain-containing protein, partial [Rubrimonas sp.]